MPRKASAVVDPLLGVLDDEVGAVLPRHEAAKIAEEMLGW